jgi:hypothetical protein
VQSVSGWTDGRMDGWMDGWIDTLSIETYRDTPFTFTTPSVNFFTGSLVHFLLPSLPPLPSLGGVGCCLFVFVVVSAGLGLRRTR